MVWNCPIRNLQTFCTSTSATALSFDLIIIELSQVQIILSLQFCAVSEGLGHCKSQDNAELSRWN